jgi:hypothetical protein
MSSYRTRQTDGKNWGLVWRNRKKISQIIKDYFHLLFFLLIILWLRREEKEGWGGGAGTDRTVKNQVEIQPGYS